MRTWGDFHINDLVNGYLLIECPNEDAAENVLFEGPWMVSGLVLQLTPWQPFSSQWKPNYQMLKSGLNFIICQFISGIKKL